MHQITKPQLKKLNTFKTFKTYIMTTTPICIENTFNASVESVWNALTLKAQMKHWYFDLDAFVPEVGFEFSFVGQGHKGEQYIHLCKVTQVIPLKRLQYSWAYKGYKGTSLVTFELLNLGETTKLTLTHSGLESFPKHPDFAKESFNAGWTHIITIALKEFLQNH